jgi:hypothetical protein
VELTVKNVDGSETVWQLENGPKNMLSRRGWDADTLKPGDKISVEIHPLTNGEAGARFMSFQFEDAAFFDATETGTIFRIPPPDPVTMSVSVARNFNGIWVNAQGGIHFDTLVGRYEQTPPLRSEYMKGWKQRRADAEAGKSTNDPTSQCIPAGFPRFLGMVYPGEILQTDHQINWYAEWGESTLRIYLDGRSIPEKLEPSYNGFTTGKWNGSTLETRTIGLHGETLVDTTGVPHSEEMEVTMAMKKLTPDYLEVAVTLNDPVVFYEPWKTIKRYARAPAHFSIQEYSCFEGNKYRYNEEGEVEIDF